jgi:hypothetical protein
MGASLDNEDHMEAATLPCQKYGKLPLARDFLSWCGDCL